jgi:hypothetical protein
LEEIVIALGKGCCIHPGLELSNVRREAESATLIDQCELVSDVVVEAVETQQKRRDLDMISYTPRVQLEQ